MASAFVDRTYIYDKSIDNHEARLLFRMVDGQIYKTYVDDMPEWATMIYDAR